MIALRKSISNTQRRILDHKVFVNGEINDLLHNFELKRNDCEVEALFQATETAGELKYELTNRCHTLGTNNLDLLSKEVKTLLAGVEGFLSEANQEKLSNDFLLEARREREQRKLNFCKDLQHNYERIDSSFEQKEEEIVELYSDLQLKLNIPKTIP